AAWVIKNGFTVAGPAPRGSAYAALREQLRASLNRYEQDLWQQGLTVNWLLVAKQLLEVPADVVPSQFRDGPDAVAAVEGMCPHCELEPATRGGWPNLALRSCHKCYCRRWRDERHGR
ncbi:hypothetical protein CF319_g9576, partial [Tilletia indica]